MMKSKKLILLGVCLLLALPAWATREVRIQEVEFTETRMDNVIRTLSELSQSNIIATPEAAKKTVTIHLKNVSVLDAIKSISRISDLWYRYDDDTDTYRLMTREEYGKDLIVRESDNIEIFRLLNANVQIIAQAIEDIYGQRVILSLGIPAASNSMGNSSGVAGVRGGNSTVRNISSSRQSSRRSSSRSRTGSGRGGFNESGVILEAQDLSIDQIDRIATALEQSGNRNIDQQTLQENTVQSQPIYITVNNEHNMLIVRSDDQAVLSGIRQLVSQMDIPVPQVMLEMRILNVILGEDFNSIFNLEVERKENGEFITSNLLSNNALTNEGTFIYEILNGRLRANIEFLEQNQRVKVLSNPMIVASNHRQAELFIGQETLLTEGFEFFGSVIGPNGTLIQPSYVQAVINREDIGITLRITPRINADGTVELGIEQENSTVNRGGGTVPVSNADGEVVSLAVDTVDTARLTGTVMAKDGLTVAVGGLIRTSKNSSERKVPLLGEIPVIGRVFRSTIESEEETETVLLITPRIMNVPQESEKLRQTDNRFYQKYNQHFPETQEFDNKFIQVNKAAEESNFIPDHTQAIGFTDMTNFAAQMVRTPELQRADDGIYKAVKVIPIAAGLVSDPAIKTVPRESWNKGYHYVTAISLFNRSDKVIELDDSIVNGEWVSIGMESEQLTPTGTDQASTMIYLVSDAPFNDVLSDITSGR